MSEPTSHWEHLLIGLDEEADPYASAYERLTMPHNAIAATKEVVRLRTEMEKRTKFLESRANRCQQNSQLVAAVGHRETAKKITKILEGKEQ